MEKDDDKRVLDGPITSSMRTDHPSQQSIEALRERYAMHEKMTNKKPAVPFDTILEGVAREEQEPHDASEKQQHAQEESPPSSTAQSAEADVFERVPPGGRPSQAPLPSGRHPDTPTPGGKGKFIIKV